MRRIWIASWALDCCGQPFGVGSEVTWPVRRLDADERAFFASVLGDTLAGSISDCEASHDPDDGRVHGVVEAIQRVRWNDAPRTVDAPPTGSARVEPRRSVDKWEDASGWLVDVDVDVENEPAG